MTGEFVDRLAEFLVSGGVGQLEGGVGGAVSGASVQTIHRREPAVQTLPVILLSQTGGASFPRGVKEEYGVQVLVDAPTISGAKTKAREVYDLLHETIATVMGDHKVLWLRAIAPPQSIPNGPRESRFQYSTNFNALLVRDE